MRGRQAVIGAAVAAALVLGANAGSLERAPSQSHEGALHERIASTAARVCGGEPRAAMISVLRACSESAVSEALDIVGEITAHLKVR